MAVAAAGVLGRLFAAGCLACLPAHCLTMDLDMAALGGALLLVLRVVRGGEYLWVEAVLGWNCAGSGLLVFPHCGVLWRGQLIAMILYLLLLLRHFIA